MLNELHLLERGLADHGLVAVARHPDISQLLKGDVIRVRLDASGALETLELLPGKSRPDIWTLRDGKHNGFPGLKTARGLLVLDKEAKATHDDAWKVAKNAAAKRAEIERLIQSAPTDPDLMGWPKPGHRARIAERLRQLRALEKNADTAAVPAVFERFLKALDRKPPFLSELLGELIGQMRDLDEWLDVTRAALVGPVSFAVDVIVDHKEFARSAGDARQIDAVSHALAQMEEGEEHKQDGVCALTGSATHLLEGPFPQPTLPSLGQTYLFSRNKDIPALARYGRNGPGSFPVGADLVSRFSGALSAMTAEEQHGKTWRRLAAEAGDGQDLLITFVASAMDERIADSLAADADADDEVEERPDGRAVLKHTGKNLIGLWQGITAQTGDAARILILRTVDPGNRKAVYDRRPTVAALKVAAQEWTKAMANAPQEIAWPVFVKRKQVVGRPTLQSPLSLIQLSRKLYIRGGREATKAPGISGAEALALFLNEGNRARRAERILHLLLDRHTDLLVGIAHANRRGQLKDFDPKASARVDALRSISWIGALLRFVGRTREAYMKEVGFKLGQLLSAVDAVHMGYCADVRDGSVPPTLVGNSVFAIAGRNPERALAVLQTRWKPYHAWATRTRRARTATLDKGDAKGWAVVRAIAQARYAERLCEELHLAFASMTDDDHTPDDSFRAELLLGYLAGLRPEAKADSSETNEEGIAA